MGHSSYFSCLKLKYVYLSYAGSGRVSFNSRKSYMKAVQAAFVEIKTPKFTKKVKKKFSPYIMHNIGDGNG